MSSPSLRGAPLAGLRAVARDAIAHGLREGRPPELDPGLYPDALREPRASFVTLHRHGELRGCTGSLEPDAPLVVGTARNAFRAAFADPRFPPLAVRSEAELLARLRPGVDGLVLREDGHAATFLPAVWETLPTPEAFVGALLRKAGLAPGHWSPALRFARYTTESAA